MTLRNRLRLVLGALAGTPLALALLLQNRAALCAAQSLYGLALLVVLLSIILRWRRRYL